MKKKHRKAFLWCKFPQSSRSWWPFLWGSRKRPSGHVGPWDGQGPAPPRAPRHTAFLHLTLLLSQNAQHLFNAACMQSLLPWFCSYPSQLPQCWAHPALAVPWLCLAVPWLCPGCRRSPAGQSGSCSCCQAEGLWKQLPGYLW